MLQSIKDKRLRRELPRLNYETKWEEGENVVQVPEYNIAVQVTDLYPFRCPTLEIDGLSEKDYVAKFEEMTGVTMPVMNTYASSWCPVFGVERSYGHDHAADGTATLFKLADVYLDERELIHLFQESPVFLSKQLFAHHLVEKGDQVQNENVG